jgi:hypothetical protein
VRSTNNFVFAVPTTLRISVWGVIESRRCLPAVHASSPPGTKQPNPDVSSTVAIGGRPDMTRIAQFGLDSGADTRRQGLTWCNVPMTIVQICLIESCPFIHLAWVLPGGTLDEL